MPAGRGLIFRPTGEPTPIYSIDFTGLTPGTITIPAGMTFARAAMGANDVLTVQTNATTIVGCGQAANTPRVGQFGADNTTRGLVLEETAIGYFSTAAYALQGQPGTGETVTQPSGGPDPLGTDVASRVQYTSGGGSSDVSSGFGDNYLSFWAKASSTTKRLTSICGATFDATIDTTWRKVGVGNAKGGSVYISDGGLHSGFNSARDCTLVFFAQENLPHPTDFIKNATAQQTYRPRETLTLTAFSNLLVGTRATLVFEWIPKADAVGDASYGRPAYAGDVPLLQTDNNTLTVSILSRFLTVATGDATTFTSGTAMNWNMFDTVQLFVEVGGGSMFTRAAYRVKPNGSSTWGAKISLGTHAAQGGILGASFATLWSRDSTPTFSSWVRKLDAYRAGDRPLWTT